MHQSSYRRMTEFARLVEARYRGSPLRILDVGSLAVNGSYRELFAWPGLEYVGLDVEAGPNVNFVPQNPYDWTELPDESFDVIVSGQALEHVEFPWLTLQQIARKLKVEGLVCLIVPSRGPEHRYPKDCYRYYPDGLRALARWAGLTVLESDYLRPTVTFPDNSQEWGDCHGIFTKRQAGSSLPRDLPVAEPPPLPPSESRHGANPLDQSADVRLTELGCREVVDVIKRYNFQASRILELGCGNGATAEILKQRFRPEYYVGIEWSPEAVELARSRLDKVLPVARSARLDPASLGLAKGDFDVLLALNVLDRLYDPWETLVDLVEFLRPGGHAVVSLLNFCHLANVEALARDNWFYSSGEMHNVHRLRFFTRHGMRALIAGAGLEIVEAIACLHPRPDMQQYRATGNTLTTGRLVLQDLTRDEIVRLFAHQYVFTARKPAGGSGPELPPTSSVRQPAGEEPGEELK
jgi:SAM-dependent methyltransferase